MRKSSTISAAKPSIARRPLKSSFAFVKPPNCTPAPKFCTMSAGFFSAMVRLSVQFPELFDLVTFLALGLVAALKIMFVRVALAEARRGATPRTAEEVLELRKDVEAIIVKVRIRK